MGYNMKDKFVASNFDEIDIVMDTDTKFDEAIAAADAGEEDLVDAIVKDMKESGVLSKDVFSEDDITEYNPEDDDAVGILDTTAEDIREYVSEYDYEDGDGDLIDSVMGDDMDAYDDDDYDDDEYYD